MPIDVPQCFRQVMQRVFIPALLVAARRQSAVCTRNLIQISIFFETTMIGLDVTLQTLLTYKETQQWRDLGTKAGMT